MLTILIKAYCVNAVVDIKPIYLNKYYLFQNKIYYLDKIYFCFAITKLFKHTIKKETLAQVFSCEFREIAKNTFLQNTSRKLLLKYIYTKNKQEISTEQWYSNFTERNLGLIELTL